MIERAYLCPAEPNAQTVCAEAKRLGVSLEIGEFAYPRILDGRFREALAYSKAWSQELSYPVILHGAFLDMYPGSPDPAVRSLARARIENGLEAAAALDARMIIFHTGYNPMLRGPGRLDGWLTRSTDFWTSTLDSSQFRGTVVVENLWEPSPEPMRLLCQAVNRRGFGVCIDTGHINVFARAALERWVTELAPHLKHLHIADNHGEWDEHLPVGKGTFDFRDFFSLLDAAHVKTLGATMEMTEPSDQVASYEWLRNAGFIA